MNTETERNSTRILLGPYRSGKTVLLIDALAEYCRASVLSEGEALLIVPSMRYQNLIKRRLEELIRAGNLPGLAGLQIVSFYKACSLVLRRCEVFCRVIPEAVRPSIVGRVLFELRKEGRIDHLLPIVDFVGTHGAILDLIDELERAGLSPHDVISRLESGMASNSRYFELGLVYKRYWGELDRIGYIDNRRLAFKCREVLAAREVEEPIYGLVGIDGFDRFNHLQLQVLSELSKHNASTIICFDYSEDKGNDARREYMWKDESFKDLERIFGTAHFDWVGSSTSVSRTAHAGQRLSNSATHDELRREDVRHLDIQCAEPQHVDTGCAEPQNVDTRCAEPQHVDTGCAEPQHVDNRRGEPQHVSKLPDIEAFKTVDRFFEMDEIAGRVKRSLVTGRTPSDEILVVVPSLRDYKGAIEAAFEGAGVPYFLDESIRMMTLPIVQFALLLINCFANDFARADVVKVLKSRFFHRCSFGLSKEEISTLDRRSQSDRVVGGRNHWLKSAAEVGLSDKLQALLYCLTPPSSSVASSRSGMGSPSSEAASSNGSICRNLLLTAFVAWCEDVLVKCLIVDDELEFQDPVQGWIEERSLVEMQNVFASLVQEDAILYGDSGGLQTDYEGFLKKLSHAFDKANFRAAPQSKNSVRICSVDLADNRLFDEVYIAGLVEGEMPRRIRGRGFVTVEEVARWDSLGIDIHNPRMHSSFEYALFRSLIQRARHKVVLSHPMWDMSGEELLPSFLLTGEKIVDKIVEAAPFSAACQSAVSARNYLSAIFWTGQTADGITCGEPSVIDLIERVAEPVAMVRARVDGGLESPYNGWLIDSVQSGALSVPMPRRFSASRLNDYGKCPFRYWVSHVLGVMPFEEPSVKLEVRELGETYHLALEKFYQAVIDEQLSIAYCDLTVLKQLFDRAADEALQWLENKRRSAKGEFWEYEKKEIIFRLRTFLEKESVRAGKSAYAPFLVEAAFGMDQLEGSAPPLVVTDGERRVEFRGKIDRIDVAGGLMFVQRAKQPHAGMGVPGSGDRSARATEVSTQHGMHERRSPNIAGADAGPGAHERKLANIPGMTDTEHGSHERPFANITLRVIDYKAGSTPIPAREATSGRNLQLPIYALAIERCVMPGAKVVSGNYLSLTSGGSIGAVNFERESEKEDPNFVDQHQTEKFILDYVESIARGRFTVAPSDSSVCKKCDHSRVCRVSELRTGEGDGFTD